MTIDFDTHIAAESARFLAAVDACDPTAPVPTCPDWTATDLLWHLAEVQRFWAAMVADRLAGPDAYDQPDQPDDHAAVRAFFVDANAALVAALTAAADTDPSWTWLDPDQTAGFVRRRQAHEALIHRLDAEATAAPAEHPAADVDAELAADGVAEILEVMFSVSTGWGEATWSGPVGLITATDLDRGWRIATGHFSGTSPTSGTVYTDEPVVRLLTDPANGPASDFGISATARDLDAWLWNRPTVGAVQRSGDTAFLDAVVSEGLQ